MFDPNFKFVFSNLKNIQILTEYIKTVPYILLFDWTNICLSNIRLNKYYYSLSIH